MKAVYTLMEQNSLVLQVKRKEEEEEEVVVWKLGQLTGPNLEKVGVQLTYFSIRVPQNAA